ncbi:dna-binding protein smubp-2 [gut metagenome]|uniref:Dna-binding protein smubp-2 n=1 Tax=gut metagenome TaxID=749906 RepID=J9G4L4_9ZZZZ
MPTLLQQRELLRKEYEYEKAEFRRISEIQGIGRSIKRGDCWFPITVGRSYYNSLNRLVVEISRREDLEIEHNFEYGRPISFFSKDAADRLHYLNFMATVSYAEPHKMVVVLPDESALSQLLALDQPGVQLHFDETTYRLMFEALDTVLAAKDNRLALLRDIFHGRQRPQFSAQSAFPLRYPWLNASQEQAVNEVLRARDALVVHGPPGTGKTTTLVEAISEVLRREAQVLVCAQSNTAVDWIAEQLSDRGIHVLRIGNPARVNERMFQCTYEYQFENHPDYPALWQIRRTLRQLAAQPRRERDAHYHQKKARLCEKADELELRIRHALFDNARVIASTLAGSANPVLTGHHFHTLFIDEAAQALEAACWIALQKADRVVFAGDYRQLPPTIKSQAALRGGLGRTLMEQVAELWPECVRLLTVQYRMNETLMRFSSDWFYEGKLVAAPEVRNRCLLDEMDWPLEWVDTDLMAADAEQADDYQEQFVGLNYGRINKAEAALTLRVLRDYVQTMGCSRLLEERVDFGIISPYKAQVQYLRKLLHKDETLRPLCKYITVNTVDAFQGQERDVVLVSLVRANEAGQIGFLSDLRRMNVAMTRARMKLVLLGSSATLCRHEFYQKLYTCCHHPDLSGTEESVSS